VTASGASLANSPWSLAARVCPHVLLKPEKAGGGETREKAWEGGNINAPLYQNGEFLLILGKPEAPSMFSGV